MDTAPYQFWRSWGRRLPRHASYASRKRDVDACLTELGIEPPFDELIGHWDLPRPNDDAPVVVIGEARERYSQHPSEFDDNRHSRWTLKFMVVPREHAGAVRTAMRERGLPLLLRWLDARRRLPDTARGANHALYVDYELATGAITTRETTAPSGKDC